MRRKTRLGGTKDEHRARAEDLIDSFRDHAARVRNAAARGPCTTAIEELAILGLHRGAINVHASAVWGPTYQPASTDDVESRFRTAIKAVAEACGQKVR